MSTDRTEGLERHFARGESYEEFLAGAVKLREFWHAASSRVRVDASAVARVERLGGVWRLLVLNADWCGDSVNTVPFIAGLAAEARNLELRLLDRDSNPELMDRFLTGGSRSIPKVIVLDEQFRACGVWGPRPTELQRWVREHGNSLPKEQRYRETRSWYARDGGRTVVEEVVRLLEDCAGGLKSAAGE